MQVRVHPGRIAAVLILDDLVRAIPVALRSPPEANERRAQVRRGRGAVEALDVRRHIHHHLPGVKRPAACSTIAPSVNSVSSSNGRPINCKPSGRPWPSVPAGTAMPGNPAMFTVTVKMSFKYISTG